MIEIASCFGDEALNLSIPSCSFGSAKSSSISHSPSNLPSIRNAITRVFRTNLPSRKAQILVMVTWCTAPGGHRLIVEFGGNSSEESPCVKIGTKHLLFGRNRGQKRVAYQNSDIVVSWDFSKAKFDAWSPEPVDAFLVSVSVDSELGLVLGSREGDHEIALTKAVLLSQREELSGDWLYSTKAQFGPKGELHDVLVKCRGLEQQKEEGNVQHKPLSMLSVYVDRKLVMKVKRLQWNFRGSQTIVVDGTTVDFMWNVHAWLYNAGAGAGAAVFMFKTKNKSDVGFRGAEKDEDEDAFSFSLLICASKIPN